MATIKTHPTGEDVTAFLDSVPAERRRAEGHALRSFFERLTGALLPIVAALQVSLVSLRICGSAFAGWSIRLSSQALS